MGVQAGAPRQRKSRDLPGEEWQAVRGCNGDQFARGLRAPIELRESRVRKFNRKIVWALKRVRLGLGWKRSPGVPRRHTDFWSGHSLSRCNIPPNKGPAAFFNVHCVGQNGANAK